MESRNIFVRRASMGFDRSVVRRLSPFLRTDAGSGAGA